MAIARPDSRRLALTSKRLRGTLEPSMSRLRRALPRIAVTWLLCQTATLTLAPAILWFGSSEDVLECTCIHGDHAICPMHHKPAPGTKICLMRGAGDSTVAVFSWLSTIGLTPAAEGVLVAERPPLPRSTDFETPTFHRTPPDPLPPRG
jgi:hypothetical protein